MLRADTLGRKVVSSVAVTWWPCATVILLDASAHLRCIRLMMASGHVEVVVLVDGMVLARVTNSKTQRLQAKCSRSICID